MNLQDFSAMQWLITIALFSSLIVFSAMPVLLRLLRRFGLGQHIREEGPEDHQVKAGTPTMGGLLLWKAVAASYCCLWFLGPESWDRNIATLVMLLAFVCFLLGLVDDGEKVWAQSNLGLSARAKLILQLLFSLGFGIAMNLHEVTVVLPGGGQVGGLFFCILFSVLVVMGSTNGVNFTDGLDGLASLTSLPVCLLFTWVCLEQQQWFLAALCLSLFGALVTFLFFNAYPAQIFMGDTGSMFIGGFFAAVALFSGHPFLLCVGGLIFVIECLSVALQVGYFKLTNGKRIFRMSPLHHHFCLGGLHEVAVTSRFFVVSCLSCLCAGFLYLQGWI